MIFVDTGAWYAATVPTDPNHNHAAAFLAANREPLLTTDYIVDETLKLLRARGERRRALSLGEQFFAGSLADIHQLTADDLLRAWQVFRDYADKDWSFTDCASNYKREESFDDKLCFGGVCAVILRAREKPERNAFIC